MAADEIRKPYKWLPSKVLKLTHLRRRSRSKSSSTLTSPQSPMSPLTPQGVSREDELKEVFRHFDSDSDGKISTFELRAYFGSIGEYMSQEEARGVIGELDRDGDDLLDLEDFVRLMVKREDGDEDLRKAFEMFEYEKGSGCITPKGLQRMLNRLGDECSYDECVAMIQVFDVDGDGVLDFHEFQKMMA